MIIKRYKIRKLLVHGFVNFYQQNNKINTINTRKHKMFLYWFIVFNDFLRLMYKIFFILVIKFNKVLDEYLIVDLHKHTIFFRKYV